MALCIGQLANTIKSFLMFFFGRVTELELFRSSQPWCEAHVAWKKGERRLFIKYFQEIRQFCLN